MSGRSVNLTTLFLGRLRPPKRGRWVDAMVLGKFPVPGRQ